MSLSEAAVQGALRQLVDPNTGKDFVSTRSARNIKVAGEDVSLDIELGYPGRTQLEPIRRQVVQALKAAGARNVSVNVSAKVVAHAVQRGVKLIPGIKTYTWSKTGIGQPMGVRPAGDKKWSQMPPRGMAYWESLRDIVQYEHVMERDRLILAQLTFAYHRRSAA